MPTSLTILDLLIIPEWGRLSPITHSSTTQSPVNIAIGLLLSNGKIEWGYCSLSAGYLLPGWQRTVSSNEAIQSLRHVVAPALIGQTVTEFRKMGALVDSLQENVEMTRTLPPVPTPEVKKLTRRGFITAGLTDEKPPAPPREKKFSLKRTLHPAVRYGTSQALLRAIASVNGRTPAQQLAYEWGIPIGKDSVKIQLKLNGEDSLPVSGRITGFNFAVPLPTTIEILGEGASIFEKWVGHVQQQLKPHRSEYYDPVIVVDSRGLLSDFFDHDYAKLLDCLSRIDLASRPATLWLLDPVVSDNSANQVKAIRDLIELSRLRQLKLKLGVGHSVSNPTILKELIESGSVCVVHIDLPAYGSVLRSMEAIHLCRENDIPFTIGDAHVQNEASLEFLADIAIVMQPERVLASDTLQDGDSLRLLYGAMNRQATGAEAWRKILEEEE